MRGDEMTKIASSSIEVERASDEDLPAIEELLSACKLPVDGVQDIVESFVVARTNGNIVGAAAIEPCGSYGLLRSVAVDESTRGHGIGRALVDSLLADAKRRGFRELYLLTTTAENYFPRFGFVTTSRDTTPAEIQATSQFRDICPSSATVMRRAI
jgi:amino-acid N-acetyltransferase